jgi:ribonuclease HII
VRCTTRAEEALRRQGYVRIAGVDEAGRGSLFGPVYAAAVVLSRERPVKGVNDSKQLDPEAREELAFLIRERAEAWAVARAEADEIDRINILQASRLAMRRALAMLAPACDYVLADAVTVEWPCPQKPVIKGDAKIACIAAASILAKTERDAALARYDEQYPGYGFARHKGYATPEHLEALQRLGPTSLHRMSYAPVQMALQRELCL